MFGERRNLVLPVANISADAAHQKDDQGAEAAKRGRAARSVAQTDGDDEKSYHEMKLNMTNFRGSREAADQQAIESEQHVRIALPEANATSPTSSMEQIEFLALRDLNGTGLPAEHRGNSSFNETSDELLPEPEQLIRLRGNRPRPIAEKFDNIYLYVSDYPLLVFLLFASLPPLNRCSRPFSNSAENR